MEVPNDECQPFLRMEEFSSIPPYAMPQAMQPVTPMMPWESYGIMGNPFQNPMNPMQMMRQVYQQQPQAAQPVPSPVPAAVQPVVQPMLQPVLQPVIQPVIQPVLQPVQPKLVNPDAAKASPDAIRSKLRDSMTEALKMVATEQPKDELAAFLDARQSKVNSEASEAAPPAPPIQALAEVLSPVVRKPRSKPNKRMRLEVSFEERAAEHAKLVAKNIEIELLRMFRGVDRKYREKARSFMFNLKDKNNPELRFRVFVGEIGPQEFCAMTTEELASKELSQWRIAKAEERAQMVVITDEDVNPSKLVKKTHKGEIIMEVDNEAPDVPASTPKSEDDGDVDAETTIKQESIEAETTIKQESIEAETTIKQESIEAETTIKQEYIGDQTEEQTGDCTEERTGEETEEGTTQVKEETPDPVAEEAGGEKAGSENVEESTDVLLDVSDFKGLPEIMSMDGFLKSREKVQDTEMKDAENIPSSDSNAGADDGKASEQENQNPLKRKQPEEDTCEKQDSPTLTGSPRPTVKVDSPKKTEEAKPQNVHLWDGSLQLTVTRSTAVHAVFRSGHDVKLESWPKLLEVKGRVKLGPLAKFLKDLSLSKSRTVTAVSFYSSDMATSSLSLLKEVVDQYEKGERVGYVEPGTGYELYLFPPGKATWKFLTDNGRLKPSAAESAIPKERSEVLVGCIVWRKKTSSSTEKSSSESKKSASTSDKSKKSSSSKAPGTSSGSKTGSSGSAPRKHSSSSVSISPPAAHHHHPKSSSSPADMSMQPSLSVVQQHSVNEWQQSSLAPPADSSLPPPSLVLSGPEVHRRQFPPGFLHQLAPGSKLPGDDAPPGFHHPVTDLDDLPEYDYEGNVVGAMSYAASTSVAGTGSGGGGFQGMKSDGFQGGFQAQFTTSTTSSSEGIHQLPSSEWSRGFQQQQMEFGNSQQQQQQMFQQNQLRPASHSTLLGAPPLPPGPPPVASYGHWVHPNQAAQQKSLHYTTSSSNARYRS